MTEDVGTLPPCMFPVLNQSTYKATDPPGENISIPIPGWEASLPAENEDCVCALLGAAWALVLYQFAGVEEIAFLICRGSNDKRSTRVVTASIRPEEAVKQLLDDCSAPSKLLYQSYHHNQINSGLLLSKDDVQCSKCLIGLLVDFTNRSVSLRSHPRLVDEHQAFFVAAATAQAICGIVADPDQDMRAISLFHEQHLAQVARWNECHPIPSPPATSVYELLQPICRSQADAPAICSWDGEITYGELDRLTGQLMAHLQAMNVRPNAVVALCFEKSLWAVLGMLSVIRTGAAFVFLDPSHPPAHRQLLLSQARPVLILTSASQQQLLFDNDAHTPVLPVNPTLLSQIPSNSPTDVFKPPNGLHDPAFLVFTSGSSGTPKGCLMDHGSLAGMIPLGREWPFDATCNRIFQFAPFVFGTSYLEIFSALLTGGVLCIASDHEWKNDLIGSISRMRTTGLVLPPSLAKITSPDMLPTVRMLAVGGEPLDASLLDRWADRVHLVQAYGMSENAGVLTFRCAVTRDSNPRNVGQSSNCRLWLVSPDDHHQLAPVGAVGELLFEGPGIARKYLSHPELSAATFVEWPAWRQQFTTFSGRGRLLKTGDLARYNTDGTINHLGRKDSQVKIRGQRVDLKEIELSMRPQLGSSFDIFVELVFPKSSTPTLAAFLFSKDAYSLGPKLVDGHGFAALPTFLEARIQLINSSLRRSLPVFMVPTVYLLLAALPTTITGKVDRRALREKVSALTRAELDKLMYGQPSEMVPPSTPMEKRLVRLMADTLQLEYANIAVSASFLKLGGDSITAMVFVRKCQSEQVVVTLQDIFQAPTIASLAQRAQVRLDTKIGGFDQNLLFGLTPAQRHILSGELSSTGSSLVLELQQQQKSSQVADAIQSLLTRHPTLRARFVVLENGEARQMVMDAVDGVFHFEEREIKLVEDLECLRETGIRLLDPYASPVFGAYLIQRAGGKQMLLLFAHDMILDSLSWLVLQSDLEQLLSGNTLRDVPSFQKWCDLIQERVKTNDILEELASEGWAGGDYDSNILIHESKHLRGQTAILDSETCHLLFGDCCESLQVRPWQIVLAALTRSYNLVFCDRKPPSIAAQINGRDIANPSLDFSHAAGRFDSILVCPGPRNLGRLSNLDLVRRIRDSAWLSLVDDMARALPSLATVDILLHNLITSDASMGQPDGSHPKHSTPYSRCSGLLELVATGTQNSGTIELTYTYSDVLGTQNS